MTTQDERSLKNEIQHIFDSGANEIRILEMVKSFIEKRGQALYIHDVSGMLPDQTNRYIDLAYLTGVFNVSGIDGLQKELTRLKEIGKNPHDIFTEGNYR